MNIKIGNKKIGESSPVFIIAELSGNHNQNFDIAAKTLEAMKKAGADAVKLQTYTADTLTIDSKNKYFQIRQGKGLWDGKTLYGLYQEAYTPWEWHAKLKKIAQKLELIFFSTPFDFTAVDFLEKMNVPAYKIASFELNDIPLVKYISSKKKPVIMSTGMSTLSDIEEAVEACEDSGNKELVLLKCTSAYPARFEDANLLTIQHMSEAFGLTVGLSDHTLGISVPIAAASLGAKVVEKHFILDRNLKGPDSAFSLEPNEFKNMVRSIREVEKALGKITYELSENVKKSKIFQRSLFVVKDLKKGEVFTKKNIRSIRPGYGLPPKYIDLILGKKAKKNIQRGTPLAWEFVL